MSDIANAAALDLAFRTARTVNKFTAQPVSDESLRQLYDLLKVGSDLDERTAAAAGFCQERSRQGQAEARAESGQRRQDHGGAGHRHRGARHPAFHEHLAAQFPVMPTAGEMFATNEPLSSATAFRNGSLQGAYLIIAARLLGLDAGPMSRLQPQGGRRSLLSPMAATRPTSCSNWDTATPAAITRVGHAWASTKSLASNKPERSPQGVRPQAPCPGGASIRYWGEGPVVEPARRPKIEGCKNKEPLQMTLQGLWIFGGVDGTRTRDPRRDRPVF